MSPAKLYAYSLYAVYFFTAPRLRRLFIRWSYLEHNERMNIDEVMQIDLQEKEKTLYNTLRDALEAWEHLQDTQGITKIFFTTI